MKGWTVPDLLALDREYYDELIDMVLEEARRAERET